MHHRGNKWKPRPWAPNKCHLLSCPQHSGATRETTGRNLTVVLLVFSTHLLLPTKGPATLVQCNCFIYLYHTFGLHSSQEDCFRQILISRWPLLCPLIPLLLQICSMLPPGSLRPECHCLSYRKGSVLIASLPASLGLRKTGSAVRWRRRGSTFWTEGCNQRWRSHRADPNLLEWGKDYRGP